MIGRNHSYFDSAHCRDRHFIVTGYTNDRFCNDMLQMSDVTYELYYHLRYQQKFDAVVFFDSDNMIYCYDWNSYKILRGEKPEGNAVQESSAENEEIIRTTPMERRRRRTRQREDASKKEPLETGFLTMGRRAIELCWTYVTELLRYPLEYRCAVVFSNMDSLISSMSEQAMKVLEELQSYDGKSIAIYLFRATELSTLLDSIERSEHSTNQWGRFARNVLLSRVRMEAPNADKVISLRTPNSEEIKNLLNYFRLRRKNPLRVETGAFGQLSEMLAASCARQGWGLKQLWEELERSAGENPDKGLSMENWREFTKEPDYLPPIERLEQMVGMEEVKQKVRGLWALRQKGAREGRKAAGYSRFTWVPTEENRNGHSLNVILKGGPGTGKTTVARLLSQLYYELGFLPQGQLIECGASELVSPNVAGTASLVSAKVQEAMGGVLFIDGAYALTANQHGMEAIDQLVRELSAYEGRFAVILAGYPNDIDRLLREKGELKGCFPEEYKLPDYSAAEMQEIFLQMLKHEDIGLEEELREKLGGFCEAWTGGKTRGWANAKEAQNLFRAMKNRCSMRMAMEGLSGRMSFAVSDIPENLQHCLTPRSRDLKEAFEQIDQMIGLGNVKERLRILSRNIMWGEEEKAPGNYIFSGPPGTGKTTIARRMGEILGHLRILERRVNNVTECRAADLLNGSVSLSEVVEDARRGILFIDEAHQLAQDERGHSIIRQLVPLIEDPEIRADTCFICAGYAAEMKRFLNVDPGLARRFPESHRIRFDDYTAPELVSILERMAAARGETVEPGYLRRSRIILEKYLEHRPANFGNGGFIRDTYLPGSIAARTARLNRDVLGGEDKIATQEQIDAALRENEDLRRRRRTLSEEDVPRAFLRLAGPAGQKEPPLRDAHALLGELYGKEELVRFVEARYTGDEEEDFFGGNADVGMHFSVAGPTGCGRQTAVRAAALAWKELGYLEKRDVLFVGKADLEAGFVGQTAIKTQNVIEQAAGGTLAVMYPSSLLLKNANDNSFGMDALVVIASAMREHFDDLCVVFIDTCEGMEDFFKAFPSIRSQLCRQFVFGDLSPVDMQNIFMLKTASGMAFTEEVRILLSDFFLNWVSDRGGLGEAVRSWGNGNEIDLLINEMIQNWKQAGRPVSEDSGEAVSDVKRRRITKDMFPKHMRKYLKPNRVISENALRELEEMTGLGRVKESIRRIERRLRRMPAEKVIPGLYCYVGNPGVGKTTVAKLMGGILKAANVLTQGHVIVRTARQMCDNPDEFECTLKLARNGILFIDEAHQLVERTNPYGRSVIKRLLTVLEDNDIIKKTCIILAGYPGDMEELFAMDSGLASRFGTADSIIVFDNYTPEELLRILDQMAGNADSISQIGSGYPLRLSEEYREKSLAVFAVIAGKGNPNYGNARFVRNYLHDSLDELLERIEEEYGRQGNPPADAADFLTGKDIPKQYRGILPERVNADEGR